MGKFCSNWVLKKLNVYFNLILISFIMIKYCNFKERRSYIYLVFLNICFKSYKLIKYENIYILY